MQERFIPFEYPSSPDGRYIIHLNIPGVLKSRRKQLGITIQEVADRAGIKSPQYQRIESGERELSNCSLRIGLAICAVLLLNPYEVIDVKATPPSAIKPQEKVEIVERKNPSHPTL